MECPMQREFKPLCVGEPAEASFDMIIKRPLGVYTTHFQNLRCSEFCKSQICSYISMQIRRMEQSTQGSLGVFAPYFACRIAVDEDINMTDETSIPEGFLVNLSTMSLG